MSSRSARTFSAGVRAFDLPKKFIAVQSYLQVEGAVDRGPEVQGSKEAINLELGERIGRVRVEQVVAPMRRYLPSGI
jgi:hypothetical protein